MLTDSTAAMSDQDDDDPAPDKRKYRPRPIYLATARRRARLTQTALAERVGISQARICILETTPGANATRRTRALLAYAVGVKPEDLAFGPNPASVSAIRREKRRRRHG